MKYTRYYIVLVFVCGLALAACEKKSNVENDATTRSADADRMPEDGTVTSA